MDESEGPQQQQEDVMDSAGQMTYGVPHYQLLDQELQLVHLWYQCLHQLSIPLALLLTSSLNTMRRNISTSNSSCTYGLSYRHFGLTKYRKLDRRWTSRIITFRLLA